MTRARRSPRRPGLDDKRYLSTRETLKRIGNHVCHWCGWPIDMQRVYPDPLSWSCDHKVPRAQLPADDPRHWHIDNALEAHLRCNQARGAKPIRTIRPAPEADIDW